MSRLRSSLPVTRRQFLAASACLTGATVVPGVVQAGGGEGIRLTPGKRDLFRIRLEMDVQGNVNIAKNALVTRKTAIQLPIKSQAKLDYEERYRRPVGVDSGEVTLAERYYHEATSQSELNRDRHTTELRDSVRKTVVRRETSPEVIYATEDYFRREELDLLRLPVSSVAIDQLLPVTPVTVGAEYELSPESLVSILNLTSVEASDVRAQVVTITEKESRIEFRGNLDGSVDGVPTTLRLIGKLTFDRQLGLCTWLAMAMHETREIGLAEPGFDLKATIRMVRQPLDQPIALTAPPESIDVTAPTSDDQLYVELSSDHLGFTALMDRRWRMMSDVPGSAMMRLIDIDRSIAQCDLRALATLPPGSQWTLEAFQRDVQQILGEQFRDLIEAEQFVSDAGLRVLRVVAQGSVQGVPIQWVMLHFSDDSGRRLLGTFTMEGHQVASFAGSDTQFAGTLRFLDTNHTEGSTPKGSPQSAGDEVARAIGDSDVDQQLQSTSDLR